MVRTTDQKKTGVEKILCALHFPSGSDMPCHAGSHREAPRSIKRQREWEKKKCEQESLLWF